jgi:MFS family permease
LERRLHDDISQSGLGLTLFTASAFLARLPGDSLTMHFGPRRLLALSLPVAFAGFLGILLISGGPFLFASYVLIGVGCANTVPIFYSSLGTQKDMPVADAVAAVSTIGYAGILLAPAVLGFIGRAFSLTASFALVTALLVIMSTMAMRLLRGK